MKHARPFRSSRGQRGFNLLELMMAVAIVGILLSIAVPGFREFTRKNRVTAAQNDLVTALNLARGEALRRARPVSVCASADGASCGTNDDWEHGWIAFLDPGNPGVVDGGEEILQTWSAPTGVVLTSGQAFARFDTTGTSSAALQLDVYWNQCGGTNRRRVTVLGGGGVVNQTLACP